MTWFMVLYFVDLDTLILKHQNVAGCEIFQKFSWTRIRRNPLKHWIPSYFSAGADSFKRKVVTAMKSVRIVHQLASDIVRWQEDKTCYCNNYSKSADAQN